MTTPHKASGPPPVTALRAAALFDTRTGALVENAVVVVEGAKIVAAGTAADVAIPASCQTIDLPGHTLMPGLVDAHTHLTQIGDQRIYDSVEDPPATLALKAARNIRRDLRAGVTTIRVVGTPDFTDISVRDAVEQGDIPGPRIITAARAIHASNGHGFSGGFDGVDEIRKAVRLNFRRGADLIKFMSTGSVDRRGGHFRQEYTEEEVATIVEEAHRVGRKVATHSIQSPETMLAVKLGADFIEHGHMIDDACIDLMHRKGTCLVGTLAVVLDEAIQAADLDINPVFRDIEWLPRRRRAPEVTRKAIAAGLPYGCGTDSMHAGMAYEVRAHVEIGIDASRAIIAATLEGARICGLDHLVGTLEPGKEADLIAVDGNPLLHIGALERVSLVMKAGKRYEYLPV